jgi:hypothetical protein
MNSLKASVGGMEAAELGRRMFGAVSKSFKALLRNFESYISSNLRSRCDSRGNQI